MTIATALDKLGAGLVGVAGGMYGFSLADSLPVASVAAESGFAVAGIPVLSWAGVLALVGVAVEWGRVRENLRAVNAKASQLEEEVAAVRRSVDAQAQTIALLTQALAARGVILAPGMTMPAIVAPSGTGAPP